MKFLFLGCLVLGALAVFQPLLNQHIAQYRGLAFAIWTNSFILFLSASFLLAYIIIFEKNSPAIFLIKSGSFYWWYILPGLMGLALVTGLPIMIRNFGAFSTIMAFLTGQIFTSFLYDAFTQSHSLSFSRFAALFCALLGTYLSIRPPT